MWGEWERIKDKANKRKEIIKIRSEVKLKTKTLEGINETKANILKKKYNR